MLKEVVAPLCRCSGPGDFQAAGERILARTSAMAILPTEALFLNTGSFRLRSHIGVGTCAVRLAEAVAACDQGDGFFVIHGHASKGLADILGCGERIRLTFGALRIDVDQTHGGGSKR